MFLKDIIIPDSINKFIINKKEAEKISKYYIIDFIPNLYIYGTPGSGKYTLFIKHLAKLVDEKEIKITQKSINISNQWAQIKDMILPSSDYHFEINLSKYSNNRNNLFSIIDTLTESREINSKLGYKIILIRNIHCATIEFIKYIKQKSESLIEFVRFVVIGNTCSNNLSILNGCFFTLRVAAPNKDEIKNVLINLKQNKQFTYSKRDFNKINLDLLINDNNNNLSLIINKLEMLLLNNNFYKTRLDIISEKLCKLLIEKKLSNLAEIREILYEYQTNNEDLNSLLIKIQNYFTIDSELLCENKKIKLVKLLADSNKNLQNSYKEIVHIESILFNIFSIIHT